MAMRKYFEFLRPRTGYSKSIYHLLNVLMPVIVLALVLMGFAWLGAIAILFAKWRMFAMKPRYWLPNIRANSVDILVGLSIVVFLAGTATFGVQLFWTLFYLFWVVWLKPRSDQISVIAQALIAQGLSLVAFYQAFPGHSLWIGVVIAFGVCYLSARHFLGAFDEIYYRQLSAIWAWFGASLTWVLEHWFIEYMAISQVSLIITLVSYVLAFMYYMHANNRLKNTIRTQLIFTLIILMFILIAFSDWQDKTI